MSRDFFFFFQAEDGIRDFCLSRGLGDVYKRQGMRSEQEVQETIMDWFSECENDEEIIEMESMISDLTAQERENRIYDLRN